MLHSTPQRHVGTQDRSWRRTVFTKQPIATDHRTFWVPRGAMATTHEEGVVSSVKVIHNLPLPEEPRLASRVKGPECC